MKTHIISAHQTSSHIMAKELLSKGEIVAFPTETVYGLGALFEDIDAQKKIFTVKNRPKDNPLIVHVLSLSWIDELAEDIPKELSLLYKVFCPGPITFILRKKQSIPASLCANHSTIAIRIPSHPVARAILEKIEKPLVAPSANLSGKPSPTSAQDVLEDFKGKIPLILDGENSEIGIESTVISLVDKPTILRPGYITKEEIERVLEKNVELSSDSSVASPGMKYRHYAPNAKIILFENLELLKKQLYHPQKQKVLCFQKPWLEQAESFSMQTLYSCFRSADREGYEEILLYVDEKLKQNTALMNRIEKASKF